MCLLIRPPVFDCARDLVSRALGCGVDRACESDHFKEKLDSLKLVLTLPFLNIPVQHDTFREVEMPATGFVCLMNPLRRSDRILQSIFTAGERGP